MGYIPFDTDIHLIKNYKGTFDYTHVIYANSAEDVISKIGNGDVLSKYSYLQENGVMKVELPIDTVREYNYLYFRNQSLESHWMFCFILDSWYINNEVSGIRYKIDVFNTFVNARNAKFAECTILRRHSLTDNVGDNIQPEPFTPVVMDYFESYSQPFSQRTLNRNLVLAVFCTKLSAADNISSGDLGVKYYPQRNRDSINPYYVIFFSTGIFADAGLVQTVINRISENSDNVISLLVLPYEFFDQAMNGVDHITAQFNLSDNLSNGYTPKNKKLLTYPYNYLVVSGGGNKKEYRYEQFGNNTIGLTLEVLFSSSPSFYLYPVGGNKGSVASINDFSASKISEFPQLPYTRDALGNWVNNGGLIQALFSTLTGGVLGNMYQNSFVPSQTWSKNNVDVNGSSIKAVQNSSGAGFIAEKSNRIDQSESFSIGGHMTGIGALRMAREAISSLGTAINMAFHPSNSVGNAGDLLGLLLKFSLFKIYNVSVSSDYAVRFDNYFTKYGYAQNVISNPYLLTRQRFTYVQTADCSCYGNFPAAIETEISNIFDNGVTMWNDYDTMLNYRLDNPLIGGDESGQEENQLL